MLVEPGRLVLEDLGSRNGTFVGVPPRRIERAEITLADLLARTRPREATGGIALDGSAVVTLGRGSRASVPIDCPIASALHASLSLDNGQAAPAAGRVLVGGLDLHDHFELFRGRIGFVPQDDILHADLTVWQALWYAARLRLPSDTSAAEITTRLQAVIATLGLEGTEQTRVGDQRKRGVSGGQRKRVNLAMELLTDPPILVLDEPTSGLSSTDALAVIQLLRSLADQGKTIIVTIHQPSVDAFCLFDAVAVIARDGSTRQVGRLTYFGRGWPDAVTFFEPLDAEHAHPGPRPQAAREPPATVDGLLRGLATRPVAEWVRRWEGSAARSIWVLGRSSGLTAGVESRKRPAARPVARLRLAGRF